MNPVGVSLAVKQNEPPTPIRRFRGPAFHVPVRVCCVAELIQQFRRLG
jgi:hypothetical protein